jgi:hypothetical protein
VDFEQARRLSPMLAEIHASKISMRKPWVASGHAAMVVSDRCEEAYQTVFAWICRAAEAAEGAWGSRQATVACERPILGQFGACEVESMP